MTGTGIDDDIATLLGGPPAGGPADPDWADVTRRAERLRRRRRTGRRMRGAATVLGATAAAVAAFVLLLPGGDRQAPVAGPDPVTTNLGPGMTEAGRALPVVRPGGEVTRPVFRVADHRGRYVVVVRAASWCAPCRTLLGRRDVRHLLSSGGFVGVVVAENDTTEGAWALAARLPARVPVARDDRRRPAAGSRAAGVPEIVVFAPDGTAVLRVPGLPSRAALRRSVAGVISRPVTYPDTPAGRIAVRRSLAAQAAARPARPDFRPVATTVRPVLRLETVHGEYTFWRARTVGPRGRALVFSSPRAGISALTGPPPASPPGPFVVVLGGVGTAAVRELYGRVSPGVAAVDAVLADGRVAPGMVDGGWFVVTRPAGHPKPVRLVARDAAGREVATTDRGLVGRP